MSDKGGKGRDSDVFDLGDFDNLDDSGMGGSGLTEEIDLTPTEVMTTQGGRNMRFILLATVLVLLIVLGAAGIILLALDASSKQVVVRQTEEAAIMTNTAVKQIIDLTNTAKAFTLTPSYTPTPTDTPTPTETQTFTPTPTEDIAATNLAETLTATSMLPVFSTQTAAAQTQNAIIQESTDVVRTQTAAANAATLGAINATGTALARANAATPVLTSTKEVVIATVPAGNPGITIGNGTPLPIQIVGTVVFAQAFTNTPRPTLNRTQAKVITQTRAVFNVTRTPLAKTFIAQGTAQPFVTVAITEDNLDSLVSNRGGGSGNGRLPTAGFFDNNFMGGNAGPTGLAMVGFAALGLVGVIVVARRMRVEV
jgi:cytoskeletal protein RodZ